MDLYPHIKRGPKGFHDYSLNGIPISRDTQYLLTAHPSILLRHVADGRKDETLHRRLPHTHGNLRR